MENLFLAHFRVMDAKGDMHDEHRIVLAKDSNEASDKLVGSYGKDKNEGSIVAHQVVVAIS